MEMLIGDAVRRNSEVAPRAIAASLGDADAARFPSAPLVKWLGSSLWNGPSKQVPKLLPPPDASTFPFSVS